MRRTALAALVVLAAPATARADEPAPWLFPRRVPMPTSLAMRFEPAPAAHLPNPGWVKDVQSGAYRDWVATQYGAERAQ